MENYQQVSVPRRVDCVIIIASFKRKQYFFSTDHCQRNHSSHHIGEDFVPTTYYLPMSVVPRPELPEGLCRTVEDLVKIFHSDEKEIPNPDPRFQARY